MEILTCFLCSVLSLGSQGTNSVMYSGIFSKQVFVTDVFERFPVKKGFLENCKWRLDKLFNGMYTQETQFGVRPGLQQESKQEEFKWACTLLSYLRGRAGGRGGPPCSVSSQAKKPEAAFSFLWKTCEMCLSFTILLYDITCILKYSFSPHLIFSEAHLRVAWPLLFRVFLLWDFARKWLLLVLLLLSQKKPDFSGGLRSQTFTLQAQIQL